MPIAPAASATTSICRLSLPMFNRMITFRGMVGFQRDPFLLKSLGFRLHLVMPNRQFHHREVA